MPDPAPADATLNSLAVMGRVPGAAGTQVSEISVTWFTGCSMEKEDDRV